MGAAEVVGKGLSATLGECLIVVRLALGGGPALDGHAGEGDVLIVQYGADLAVDVVEDGGVLLILPLDIVLRDAEGDGGGVLVGAVLDLLCHRHDVGGAVGGTVGLSLDEGGEEHHRGGTSVAVGAAGEPLVDGEDGSAHRLLIGECDAVADGLSLAILPAGDALRLGGSVVVGRVSEVELTVECLVAGAADDVDRLEDLLIRAVGLCDPRGEDDEVVAAHLELIEDEVNGEAHPVGGLVDGDGRLSLDLIQVADRLLGEGGEGDERQERRGDYLFHHIHGSIEEIGE